MLLTDRSLLFILHIVCVLSPLVNMFVFYVYESTSGL